ncbi:hypothetical protein BJN34_37080 (plasmid) [Cupriavidus necator]|uniref:Uncharacterized protein n=1 Tax=Cupriavidus necator TaxID=106590 RepID=A0A1U9V3I0_CUPNE|nr:hypothetical protein [Cupriavidus necator]AQV99490.1 hypothetical protein BJN34_37080 [Cupriavidus necator]
MSLETLHTKARQSLASLREMQPRIAARLFRVDETLAFEMHAWIAAGNAEAQIPSTFLLGNAAPCFALIGIAARKPPLFWGALAAIPALPVLLALHWI